MTKTEKKLEKQAELDRRVFAAISQLEGQGEKATLEKVLEITGGSNSTVGPALKRVRAAIEAASDMPDDVLAAFRFAWSKSVIVGRNLDEEMAEELAAAHEKIEELTADLEVAQAAAKSAADQCQALEDTSRERDQFAAENAALAAENADLRKQLAETSSAKLLAETSLNELRGVIDVIKRMQK